MAKTRRAPKSPAPGTDAGNSKSNAKASPAKSAEPGPAVDVVPVTKGSAKKQKKSKTPSKVPKPASDSDQDTAPTTAPTAAASTPASGKKKKQTILDQTQDAPEEVSFGLAQARAKLEVAQFQVAPKRKRKRNRQPLDASILNAVAEKLENAQDEPLSEDEDEEDEEAGTQFTGTRTTFDDSEFLDNLENDLFDTNAKSSRVKSRTVEGNITVQAITTKPHIKNFAREVTPAVNSFLKDHFFGSRIRRTDGPFQRGRKHNRPAQIFARR